MFRRQILLHWNSTHFLSYIPILFHSLPFIFTGITLISLQVPFPNLQLKTSLFMEGRPPPDLEPQNQQEEEEVVVFLLQKILIITQLKLKVLCIFLVYPLMKVETVTV